MFSKIYTVNYSHLEGGHWQLLSKNGKTYLPVNMPIRMKRPGLKVNCRLSRQTDMSGIHMTGELVRIVSYEVVK